MKGYKKNKTAQIKRQEVVINLLNFKFVSKIKSMLKTLKDVIETAGRLLKDFQHTVSMQEKDEIEVVSEADFFVEDFLKKELPKIYKAEVVGEESFSEKLNLPEEYWLVDPVDGTLNFLHKLPWVGISVALMKGKDPVLGVIYSPFLEECFYAEKGKGALLNGKPIKVSSEKELENALLVTSFPGKCKKIGLKKCTRLFEVLNEKTRGVRRFGAASLDLAYVACGRFDAFWEPFLKPWDTAAGILLVKEAGGVVSDYFGNPYDPFKDTLVASNPFLHEKLIRITSHYHPTEAKLP